jgi:hypothetical protein
MSQSCEVKRIQENSAQAAVDQAIQKREQAHKDYLACLGPKEQAGAALSDATADIQRITKEAEELDYMNQFLLRQMGREASHVATYSGLADIAGAEAEKIQKEIDELKSQIRTERRRFLDASPSTSPAVAGMYFTKVPDNQVLIAFLTCFGAFFLFGGLAVLLNYVPFYYFEAMYTSERLKFVGTIWLAAVVLMYAGLFVFT